MQKKSAFLLMPLMLIILSVFGCSKDEPGKVAPAGKAPAVNSGEGTAIELEPSPEGFPLGLGTSEGFALHLFDTPGANQDRKSTRLNSSHRL